MAAILLAALAAGGLVQHAWYWQQSPNRVATHFDIHGKPDNWMDKTSATLLILAVQLGLPLLLVGTAALIESIPNSLINIPHREYWLQADRRSQSLAYVRRLVTWIAVLASVFMMLVSHLVYVANRTGNNLQLGWLIPTLVLYLIMVLGLVGRLLWRFRLPA